MKKCTALCFLCIFSFLGSLARSQNATRSQTEPNGDAGRDTGRIQKSSPEVVISEAPPDAIALLTLQVNETFGLRESQLVSLNIMSAGADRLTVSVLLDNEPATLELEVHSVRSPKYRVRVDYGGGMLGEVPAGPVRTYRGTVEGLPGSMVAASIDDDGLHAKVILPDESTYLVEPIAALLAWPDPNLHVVYRKGHVLPSMGKCGVQERMQRQPKLQNSTASPTPACGTELCIAEIACDTDVEYYNFHGSVQDVEIRINAIIMLLNVEYERDVDIRHVISEIIVRIADDPYSATDGDTLLTQIRGQWVDNPVHPDTVQLFTGKDLDGFFIGHAWPGTICDHDGGYSVVQSDCCNSVSPNCAADLSAHELGHNWGAEHCDCPDDTMNHSLPCTNHFAEISIHEITDFRDDNWFDPNWPTCLSPGIVCTENDDCNDSNPCTTDSCLSGFCFNENNSGPCDDGLWCNGVDTCVDSLCVHAGNPCPAPDGDAICAESCNEVLDNCSAADPNGTACADDGNPCTNDNCNGNGTCIHPAKAKGTACAADTNSCTNDVCNANGLCIHPNKAPGSACGSSIAGLCDNPDSCNGNGVCLANNLANGTVCADDGNECTNDTCTGGTCTHSAKANGTACGSSANTDCSAPDTCLNGMCSLNNDPSGMACLDDGNSCTNDTCNGSGTCTHPNKVSGSTCSDGLYCNGVDTCNASGVCVHAGNPCPGPDGDTDCSETCHETADACTGNDPDNSTCSDGDAATIGDRCFAGICLAGTAPPQCTTHAACNDNNPCTNDSCISGMCQRVNNTVACADDGNACTNDVCGGGACTHPAKANGTACNDGLYCNGADSCSSGACTAHSGNPCPGVDGDADCSEMCSEASDNCTANDPNNAVCNDGNATTTGDHCDTSGACVGNVCRLRNQTCTSNAQCCSNVCRPNGRCN